MNPCWAAVPGTCVASAAGVFLVYDGADGARELRCASALGACSPVPGAAPRAPPPPAPPLAVPGGPRPRQAAPPGPRLSVAQQPGRLDLCRTACRRRGLRGRTVLLAHRGGQLAVVDEAVYALR